jgi:hypothetical protein
LTTKWKIFRVLNYLQFILAIVLYSLLLLFFLEGNWNSSDTWVFLGITVVFLSLIFNSFLNIYILWRFFPSELIPQKTRRYHNFLSFFYTVDTLGLLLIFISTIGDFIRAEDKGWSFYVFTGIFIFFVFSSPVIWYNQLIMDSYLKKIYNKKMKSLISSIGSDMS